MLVVAPAMVQLHTSGHFYGSSAFAIPLQSCGVFCYIAFPVASIFCGYFGVNKSSGVALVIGILVCVIAVFELLIVAVFFVVTLAGPV
ncbi:hypothetical protein HOV93_21780 [Planctomycetes bacterium FF15]|uniref:Uncharacterized protein n=1 Tax=Bremerella alba TaxID=980252 RepID=A0A7V8V543_9BACT|nr:hypothetical protein [Bremerella alba]